MDCIFCKIANKEIPAEIAHEDERIIAFKDIKPSAPVHYLIVPKIHIASIVDIQKGQSELIGDMVLVAKQLAEKFSLTGYKLVFNVGKEGGQIIEHVHLHLLGGWRAGSSDVDNLPHPDLDK